MPVRSIFLAALLFIAAPAAAQQAIQTQMTPEEFKAAGLDKLSADELERLDAWLNRTIQGETAKAVVDAKEKVVEEQRGFATIGSTEPIESRISGEFRGFAKGNEYTLDNGHVWKQVDDSKLSGVRQDNPAVRLNVSVMGSAWYLKVEGYNTRAKVVRIK
ncbi:hypothetical protein [Luteimonas terricola]|uniref:Secreted protein n=1 Tax=Luteimonas terricola TaxID=645597 RepID=A0ABQ2ECE0_9GAMM|nr:hypothetical protein [Luteimonas terricola]GGK00016.1 hypothetical protein GCM10011394_06520 [Luteimonas terricola]